MALASPAIDRISRPNREGCASTVAGAPLPPLLKGYLRLGAQVCGEPAWDGDFDTADVVMMLPLAKANPRYVHRLLRAA